MGLARLDTTCSAAMASVCLALASRTSRTSFFVTGFSSRLRCVRLWHLLSPSRSPISLTRFDVNTKVVRLGSCSPILRSTFWMRLRAHSSVLSLGDSGKLESVVISLSVKSIASCGPATPRFSIVGILWPVWGQCQSSGQLCSSQSVASALFSGHTSEVEFALFEGVQVGEGVVDEIGSEAHGCGRRAGAAIECVCGLTKKFEQAQRTSRISAAQGDPGLALAGLRRANAQFTQIQGWSLSTDRDLSSGGCYSSL